MAVGSWSITGRTRSHRHLDHGVAQDATVEVIAALQLLNHHILWVLRVLFTKNSIMERGIELLTHHLHPGDPLLLQDFDQLLVETLIAAMEGLSLFTLRVELLTGALEVVNNRKDCLLYTSPSPRDEL